MTDLRAAVSGLTTRGRCLLSAGTALAICALLLGQRDLLRAAVFLLALPVAAVAVVARTRYRLACTRSLDPARIEIGRTTDVRLRLSNVSRLPSGVLRMEDALPYALGSRPRFVLDRVEPKGVRDVTYAVGSAARGRFQIGPLAVRMADPFGLCELSRAFASSDELVVTPVVVALPPVPLGGDWAGGGETASRATASSGTDDVSTREYRHGDDLRKVHWRSTARVGELMVRREEQPYQSRATLLLDTRDRAHRGDGPDSSFEWAVSAVASIGVALLRAGYALTLLTDDDAMLVPPGVPMSEGLLLDLLADLELGAGRDLEPAVRRLRRGVDGVLVAVLGTCDPTDAQRVARLRSGSIGCTAVLLDTATWAARRATGDTDLAGTLLSSGWRVLRAEHDTGLAALWTGAGGRGSAPATGGTPVTERADDLLSAPGRSSAASQVPA